MYVTLSRGARLKGMIRKFISLWILTFASVISGQDREIHVKDAESGAPLPFVTISYAPERGVITNEEGYFRLPADRSISEITVSCMGYSNQTLSLPLTSSEILLHPKAVQLDEVLLQDRYPTGAQIMSWVREALSANHNPQGWHHRVFSRSTNSMDFESLDFNVDKASQVAKEVVGASNRELDALARRIKADKTLHYREFLSLVKQVNSDSLSCIKIDKAYNIVDTNRNYNPDEIEQQVKQIMLQYLDTTNTYKLKTGLFTIDKKMALDDFKEEEDEDNPTLNAGESLNSIQNIVATLGSADDGWITEFSNPENYEYRLKDVLYWNGRNVYQVTFQPSRGKAKFAGEFLVDMEDYGVHRLNYAYAEGKRGAKFNLKLLLGLKFIENQQEGIALFRRQDKSSYLPQYYSRSEGYYFYVNRPFKFINNDRRREKVKFEFQLSGQGIERREILISKSSNELKKNNTCDLDAEVPLINRSSYDPGMWESEEVLEPLQEMKAYGLKDL